VNYSFNLEAKFTLLSQGVEIDMSNSNFTAIVCLIKQYVNKPVLNIVQDQTAVTSELHV